ncbi:hypothetical protein [Hydrogenophaga intermedia]|uniref:hypothetical protein n=1 Tax=Hydrogenophaga intermedia TaxID=65786 RepID=UPI00204369D3|nr:hypothetical protein [Hydrogenophaga intermedia]MCM3563716.1 hypothetical protein [Hydrogenophaga intermedia]
MRAAQGFINALPRGRTLPKLAPDGEGGVVLAWEVPNRGRTLITIADWEAYAVSDAGTKQAQYFDDMPIDGIIPDSLLSVIPA